MSDLVDLRKRAAQQAATGNYWASKTVAVTDRLMEAVLLLRVFVSQAAAVGDDGHGYCDWCSHAGLEHYDDCLAAKVRSWLARQDGAAPDTEGAAQP